MRVSHRLLWLAGCLASTAALLWLLPAAVAARPTAVAQSPYLPSPYFPEPLYFELGRRMDVGAHTLSGLGIFGPSSCTANGDPFSSLDSPWAPGLYTYQFAIFIPPDYETTAGTSHLRVEVLDPDSMNRATNTELAYHTDRWVNTGSGRPTTRELSCTGGRANQTEQCVVPTTELQQNCTLAQQNDPTIFCIEDVDLINPVWFFRMDENRGTPTGCAIPGSYRVDANTQTRYQLAYYQTGPEGSLIRTDLAAYTGQTGDPARDFDGATSHQTDLFWVAPGSQNAMVVEVPTDCGSMTGGYNPNWNPTRCPILPGHEDGRDATAEGNGFEIDLSQDVLNMAIGEDGWRYLQFDITTISGASENGFGLWAGPPSASAGIPTLVNHRNVYIADNPHVRSAAGVQVLAVNYLPMQSYLSGHIPLPLAHVPASAGGEAITFSLFDVDSGSEPPVQFTLNSVPTSQFSITYGLINPDPEGRCWVPGASGSPCNNRWVGSPGTESPPYTVTLPLSLTDSIIIAEYRSSRADTYVWGGSREKPDLVIGGLTMVSPWPAEPNSPLTFTVAITNAQGPAIPVPIMVDVFINPTVVYTTFIPRAQSNGFASLAMLGAGETQVVTLTASLGFTNTQVAQTVCGMVDSINTIFETAEANNVLCTLLEPPPPDLTIGQLQMVSPWPAEPNSPLTFIVAVTNTSFIPVSSTIFVDLFVNPTDVYATYIPLDQSSGFTALSELGAGETRVVTITTSLGFEDITADQTVCGMVDSLSAIDETDETNNVTCHLLEAPFPDLTIGQLQMVSPWPTEPNSPLTFIVAVTNTSFIPVSSTIFVDLFVNPTDVYATYISLDQSSGFTALSGLGAGETRVVTITTSLGFENITVNQTVCGMVDSLQQIEESDETNNVVCVVWEAPAPPPPPLQRTYLPLVMAVLEE